MAGHEREKRAEFTRKLRWTDFRSVSKSLDGVHDASTDPLISVAARWKSKNDGQWEVTKCLVRLRLDATNTWVVHGKRTPDLLAHEQRHYDIAAIAARTVERTVTSLKGDGSQKPGIVIDQAIAALIGRKPRKGKIESGGMLKEVQHRYDEDASCGTNHGLNAVKQQMWNVRIREALNDTSAALESLDRCPRLNPERQDVGE